MLSHEHGISVSDPREILVDRELSWLAFNQRVLELAEDKSTPLLERCRFLAIFSSNLDDFYMIRVASLKRKLEIGITKTNTAGFTPSELMKELSAKTQELIDRKTKCFHDDIHLRLSKEGVNIVRWDELTEEERELATEIFNNQIFPVLTPLAIDPSHPFPYISGLSLNLAVVVKNPDTENELFARVKVPSNLPRFVVTTKEDDRRYIPLEQVITANVSELFPGMEVLNVYTFRVTRNADLELEEEESEDLLASMEQELLRRKFGPPVRLEIGVGMDLELLETLKDELSVKDEDISRYPEPLDLTGLNQIADIDRPELKFPAFRNQVAWDLRDVEPDSTDAFFEALKRREVILHHPYESFNSSVVRFVESAASDPKVLAIKQTLYRTSGDSPIVEALIEAAEAGKQVLAVIEIRARFDELANVRWARKLEDAGVHVVYGLVGFKTHSKLSLVVRQESGAIRRYVHMGTGNYNPKTARMYEDFGILSSDPILGDDVNKLFNQLSGFAPQTSFERLLVAPRTLRSGLLERIQREIDNKKVGKPALIRMKLNSIMDEEFIDLLYKASAAGVEVELVVRGICAIRAGVPGLSENIRVISILGRFLEHSRIFHFANAGDNELWIGSADLMHRNLDRRVESMVKINQTDHKRMLMRALDSYLAPTTSSWHMNASGSWDRITTSSTGEQLVDLHQQVINWYGARG
ncbi:MAG: RNA degradosome polyphosphate kinase [Actinobacteria bacterium]|uniref:ATP-polyphosphate phosphotransferase n=1 Tax=freshwater metagenome TaxID=449393 RepID=A0A6J6M853_9ZZZZ|nr:RNA degradosome polyphosphate kinase [Actinomycetota bacterium]MSW21729.1 RNA degradosome polyphosphate kinase [Actinomycetota bacterium]MSX04442.1 RNA degradosome polyphosphate kinase [Actinomycetota bacterium]MSX84332.1 RNA degradosome polyphosphate kinase [Actinomycetota bacterium]MSY96131.1 RNA degradosome polyphosphate kinase [Actinomycetota bacterium]